MRQRLPLGNTFIESMRPAKVIVADHHFFHTELALAFRDGGNPTFINTPMQPCADLVDLLSGLGKSVWPSAYAALPHPYPVRDRLFTTPDSGSTSSNSQPSSSSVTPADGKAPLVWGNVTGRRSRQMLMKVEHNEACQGRPLRGDAPGWRVSLVAGHATLSYRSRANVNTKVLDFVQLGGPTWTVGGTIFEMWLGLPPRPE